MREKQSGNVFGKRENKEEELRRLNVNMKLI